MRCRGRRCDLDDAALVALEAELVADHPHLAVADRARQVGEQGAGLATDDAAAREQLERAQRVAALDGDDEAAAAGRVEAVPYQLRVDLRAHAAQQRQEHLGDELEGRGHRVVGAALEGQAQYPASAAAATARSAGPGFFL